MADPPAIALSNVDKSFGAVHAVRGVSLAIEPGSITGIVGENGAGKSTLMNILYGLYRADAGEVRIDGQPVRLDSPRDAIARGIGMVHQHFMLVDSFTVLENLVLGAEGGPLLAGGFAAARAPQETEQLVRILATLKARGVTVVLITHKLHEIMAVTDHVYVMRQGEIVAGRRTPETTPAELAELMVGRTVRLQLDKTLSHPGEVLLSAEHLSLIDGRGVKLLDDIGLTLRAGEIVGVAGVTGNGQTELLQVLAGIRAPTGGRLTIGGRAIDAGHPADPAELRRLGVAHVPEDRLRQGMVAAFRASETGILGYQFEPSLRRNALLDGPAVDRHCAMLMDRFDVRPRAPGLRSGSFSGGNQQKLVLAREMAQRPRVLLVGQPTRGVDIGAVEFIHRELVKSRDAGCAVLVVSVELQEILSLADRILVMFAGRIAGEVAAADADERTLGLMMAGAVPSGARP